MSGRHILAIDQGTTSSRAMIFSEAGNCVAVAQQEFRQIFPQDGWVEHDPEDIWQSVFSVCRQVLKQAEETGIDIVGIGITNQRETTVVWASGKVARRSTMRSSGRIAVQQSFAPN